MLILLTILPTANHNIHKWVGHLTAADEIIHYYHTTSTWSLEHRQEPPYFVKTTFCG